MQKILLFNLILSILLVQNTYAQDHTRWSLPDGANARLGKGWILDIAYSNDGTRLAVGSGIGVWVYNAFTGAEIDLLTGHTSVIRSVAFSRNGSTLAGGGWDGTIHLWDATTGQHRNKLTGHRSAVRSVAFSRNGTLASGSQGGTIHLWDATTGQHLRLLTPLDVFGNAEIVNSIAFSPDGNTLASAGKSFLSGIIHLWDVTTGQHRKKIEPWGMNAGGLWSIAFSPDGSTLAGASQTLPGMRHGELYLWDANTGAEQRLEKSDFPPVPTYYYSVAFSPDSNTLISGGGKFFGGGNIDLWDADTGQHKQRLTGHAWPVRKVAFSQDGRFASGGGEELILWGATGRPLNTITGHKWLGRSVAFSQDGTLVSGNWAGSIDLWDADTAQHEKRLPGHVSAVRSVAFSRDGRTLAAGKGGDHVHGSIDFRDTTTGKVLHSITGLEADVWSVAFSPDGTLASGSTDGIIRLWNASSEQSLGTFEEHRSAVWSVAFSSDGKTLASGDADGIILLWNVTTGRLKQTLEGHTDDVRSIAFSPDDSILVSGSLDRTIRLWDAITGQPEQTLEVHLSEVWSVAFSRDGSILASGSLDGTVLLWDMSPYITPQTSATAPTLDFDGDGIVGISDFLLFVDHFGLTQGDAGYDARYDLDGDGSIGISDFLIFANAFGKDGASN